MPDPQTHPQVRRFAAALDRVRAAVRALLVLRAVAWIAAAAIAAIPILALIDLGLRLPAVVRAALLLAGLIAVAAAGAARVKPAWNARLSRAALAHRLEHADPAHAGRIAPAVNLLELADHPGPTGAMARTGIDRAGARLAGINAWKIVRWSGVVPSVGALAGASAAVLLIAVLSPTLSGIGARRVLTPWADARWPTRYGVEDLTDITVHPIDEALPVRVTVGPADAGGRVRLEWRAGDARQAPTPMAPQPVAQGARRVYERLIDPAALADRAEDEATLRYRVLTPDDRSAWTRVRLVRPPKVRAAAASVLPPPHAAGAPGLANFRTGDQTLPTGDATLGPLLEGSVITLTWSFSTPVTPVDPEQWSTTPAEVIQTDERTIQVNITARATESDGSTGASRITPAVADRHALGLRLPVSVTLDTRADAPPGVAINEPSDDQTVTPMATLPVVAQAVDDIGLTAMSLEAALFRPPADSPDAPREQAGDTIRLSQADIDPRAPPAQARASARLTPAGLGARPGDEIALYALAQDTRGPASRTRSAQRLLRVVTPEQLAERLHARLAPLYGLLRRADNQQAALIERTPADPQDPTPLVRDQVALADAAHAALRSAREIEHARARNALQDPPLESLLRDLDSVLSQAEHAAREAARSIEARRTDQARRQQQDARDRIGEAMAMLDRGQDAFLARRAVARLREQLAHARQETGAVGATTAGQPTDALAPEDRSRLDSLAQAQQAMADQAREAVEELARQAESLEKNDPAQAEALRRAAEQGRAGAVASRIQDAARQTAENQTGQAQQSQQQALEQLDRMLEQIDAAEGLRDTALRRKLATLIASITQLLNEQTRELESLALAIARKPTGDLADGMIALRENTLGVIEEASAKLTELRMIAQSLQEAQNAQADAAGALRQAPPALEDARRHEQVSLAALERALAEANKQDDRAEQREQQRKKAELRKAYRDALEDQTTLRDHARPLIGRELSRRERVEARAVGARQRELADTMSLVREGADELDQAPAFQLAHAQLDLLMRSASDGLGRATPGRGVALDQDQAVAILASLVQALADAHPDNADEENFQQAQGAQGQGAGGASQPEPLIPPVAQLRLLRDMQQGAMEMTRRLHENPTLGEDPTRVGHLADLQQHLAERGTELIESMNRTPPPDEPSPEEPPEKPAENPADTEPSALPEGSTPA